MQRERRWLKLLRHAVPSPHRRLVAYALRAQRHANITTRCAAVDIAAHDRSAFPSAGHYTATAERRFHGHVDDSDEHGVELDVEHSLRPECEAIGAAKEPAEEAQPRQPAASRCMALADAAVSVGVHDLAEHASRRTCLVARALTKAEDHEVELQPPGAISSAIDVVELDEVLRDGGADQGTGQAVDNRI